jgi:hypothetical protein
MSSSNGQPVPIMIFLVGPRTFGIERTGVVPSEEE